MQLTLTALWAERKFRTLSFGILLVALFEILSLSGYTLPAGIGIPLFGSLIVGIGRRTLRNGFMALKRFAFSSIDLLMTIAVVGSFFIGQYVEGAIVVVLFTLSEYLEDVGIQASRSALKSLVERVPKTAQIKGKTEAIPLSQIVVGDIVVVQPSDLIPIDGEIVAGKSSVDESTITGEPIPKDKFEGDSVYAGTLNLNGYLEVQSTKPSKDTTLAKIVELTFNAGKTKALSQKFIERFSRIYTPSILFIAAMIATIPTLLLGQSFDKWFAEALTLLVIGCPCALVISTPVSIFSSIGNASGKGIVIKGGKVLEEIGRVKAIAFDKTRTITEGRPRVSDVVVVGDTTREHLLANAAGIEQYSEHPLAVSILEMATAEGITPHAVENYQSVFGKGATADCLICTDTTHAIGKLAFIREHAEVSDHVLDEIRRLSNEGKTVLVSIGNSTVEGVIAVTDTIKAESRDTVSMLSAMGVGSVMLTGDSAAPSQIVADRVGISDVRADLLPEDKAAEIGELKNRYGYVAMVGDGVNDAPALALATVGIAMGARGSDTAIESADIAILNDNLSLVPFLVALGRRTRRTILANVSMAITVKVVFIVLAVSGYSNLALAIFADVGITLIVIMLSLRLVSFEYQP